MQEVRNLKKNSKSLFILCFLFLILLKAFGLNVPSLKGRVNDLAGIIFADEEKKIEEFLFEVEKRSDLQIAVLTIPSLEGENLEDYSMRVAEAWQLGSKEHDSGVLLLVAAHDRKMRIEVGYGLESTLTDADAGRIIRNIIGPEFRNGNYGSGILQGVKTIAGYVLQDETLMKHNSTNENTSLPGIQVAAEVSGVAELREVGRKRRVFRRGISEMSSSPRIKKALQNFYSAFYNTAAYLQPEASGLFLAGTSKNAVFRMPYRYITEYL